MIKSDLYRAVRERQWDNALSLLRDPSTQHQAQYIGGWGWNRNALHWACHHRDTPSEIIHLLLSAHTDAALVQDDDGCTPLHIAADRRGHISEHIKIALIKSCPKAVLLQRKGGYTPLHMAVLKDRSKNFMEALLNADPSVVTLPNDKDKTPLQDFFALWNNRLNDILRDCDDDVSSSSTFLNRIITNNRGQKRHIHKVYDKAILFLKASYKHRPFIELHACLSVPSCPYSFFRLLLKLHPDQVLIPDHENNLPLHKILSSDKIATDGDLHKCSKCKLVLSCVPRYVAKNAKTHLPYPKTYCEDCFRKKGLDEENWMKVHPVYKYPKTILNLLSQHPQTANIPNHRNKLPFHLAIEQGEYFQDEVLQTIFHSAPNALFTRDVETHLLPFMAAAVKRGEQDTLKQFTGIFQLLSEEPNLVSWGIPSWRYQCDEDG